jgi:lantibiotic transport system permease protein
MPALARAMSAEILKMKRTLALLVALVLPMVVIFINFVMFARQRGFADGFDGWGYFVSNNIAVWTVLMLPLYITLETALLAGLEHNQQGWKHLAALPIPRSAVYAAKQIIAMGMVALSMLVMIAGIWGSANLAHSINLNTLAPFNASFPWERLLRAAGLAYVLSLLMVAIHNWIATRFASFAFASGVGIGATVMGFFIINDETLSKIFPWALPINALMQLAGTQVDLTLPLAVSLIGALLVSVMGGWNVVSRDVL